MAANLLHSLTDDNVDLQKQIGCMTGIFQMFDRQHILTSGRRLTGPTPKRLPSGNSRYNGAALDRDSNNANLKAASLQEKYSHKNVHDRQRVSTESSRASFSSSSRSSSFSSIDCNRPTQLEPASFDRIIFPENPPKDPAMSRQSLDLRDLVKDSMYREVQGLSVKAKALEETTGSRPQSQIGNEAKKTTPADLKESLRVLAKLQESTWYHNEPRELTRSSSYHAKDGSSFSIARDAPRFSYDGREINRAPFDSRDVSKSTVRLKDLPRLSLDSREGSVRSLNADAKSNFFSRNMQKDIGEFDEKVQSLQQAQGNQARPPSVVAKLMGLEALPNSVVSSGDVTVASSRSYQDEDFLNVPKSSTKTDQIQLPSSSSKSLWKEPSSPRWRNPDSSMKPSSRFPMEPAPWKQIEGARGSSKSASRTTRRNQPPDTFSSVYSEIEKRLKDIEFTQSGKDLRALKQILEAMQAKGLLETQKEGQDSNFTSHREHENRFLNSMHDARSANNQKPQADQFLASQKRRPSSARNYESPIVIMKPAKLVEKSGIPAASLISLDGLSGLPKLRPSDIIDNRKGLISGKTSGDLTSRSSQRDNAVNSVSMKSDRTLKSVQASTRSQQLPRDGNASSGKSSGSISPRMQQKKLELEKRSRPPTPRDSSKSKRLPNKQQQAESKSPGGRRRPKNLNGQLGDDQLSDISVESRSSSQHGHENIIEGSDIVEVNCSEKSPGVSCSKIPSKKSNQAFSEDESADCASVPPEYSSPVSVLDSVVYKDDSPSPVKYVGKTLKVDVSMDNEGNSSVVQGHSVENFVPSSKESGSTSEINRKKLKNIDNLVQKLRRLNSTHDEARTDYIASLCENTKPDDRYISEILLASGLLLRDIGSSLTNFQFHPSGHPINPELYLVLEQTKASTLIKEEFNTDTSTQIVVKEKSHRKLIFDAVNEILARKFASADVWLRPFKLATKALNAQRLLRELCSEIEELQAKDTKSSSDEEDDRWKNILYEDVLRRSEIWIDFDDEISGAVLDVERLIFKDLVDEIVIGESTGLKTKPGRQRQLFSK